MASHGADPVSGGSVERAYALAEKGPPAPFGKVICGVDATPASREAVRQAATIAGRGSRVVFVCAEPRPNDPLENDRALAEALATAEDLGACPTGHLSNGVEPPYALLERAGPDDLVVVGTHDNSRVGGMLSGSVATTLLHRAHSAVLIARPPPTPRPFPRDLLVASDGSRASTEAVRIAGAVARRHHSRVTHLHAGVPDAGLQSVLSAEVLGLEEVSGKPPAVLVEGEPAHEAIVTCASEHGCSLVVMGHRGLTGLSALRSVAERVGHAASCSVLVTRPLRGA